MYAHDARRVPPRNAGETPQASPFGGRTCNTAAGQRWAERRNSGFPERKANESVLNWIATLGK